ncbi:hypothetical protein M2324_003955 [Rhodovulum sulfidophilum]|uniref:hypothetical protein n=1 Tax=Rhodovulum sulfidophilum TaxID=35806 RepID=UPI000B2C4CFB|nr:hypothetical protein [Rhodovulum sulfidophilum]MCW2305529.1 hypothetical protein [Rhodovulum sulfidophilum]
MASNKHYEIDLKALEAVEVEPPPFEELLRLADLPNSPNPFGNTLKRGKFVNDEGKKWILDEQISDFNYQTSGYGNEVSQFRLQLSFDTPLELRELDAERFLYSISRHIAQSSWREGRRGVGAYFQLGHLEEGSIRGEIYAGVVAVGAFVANYPALKDGFQEILTDAQFVTEQVTTAIRAAKLPAPIGGEHEHEAPEMYVIEEAWRRHPHDRQRLLRDD